MEIEIRTTTNTWFAQISDSEIDDTSPGGGAAVIRARIQAGIAIEVKEEGAGRGYTVAYPVAFNPSHIVCVIEKTRRRRQANEARTNTFG